MALAQEIHPAFRYALLALPATVLLIIPSFDDPINIPKVLALVIFAFTSAVLYLALRKSTPKKLESRASRIYLALYLLLVVFMLISGFLGSQNYIRILFGTSGRNNGLIYYLSALVIVLVILRLIIGVREIEYVYRILIWTSLPFAIYSSIQYLDLDPVAWNNPSSKVIGTLGNPNFSASALAIFSVFWFYVFFRSSSKNLALKFSMLIASAIMAFLSWSTESLQGLVVIALGFALVGYIQIRQRNSNKAFPIIFFGVTALGLVISFASFLGFGPLGDLLEQYTLKLRGWYALIGLRAMIDSPWIGVGVDSYVYVFRSSRGDEFVSQYGANLANNNAHSTPAQVGATFGVIVFLFYCLIHLLVLYKALQIINTRSENQSHLKGIAIIWILVFSQSLLSIEIIGLGVMNWILGALILSSQRANVNQEIIVKEKSGKKVKAKSYPAWVGSLTIAALLLGSIPLMLISREDRAYIGISRIEVTDEASKDFVRENFSKLSDFSLLQAEKVDKLVGSLYRSDMFADVERIATRLYEVSPDDAFAGDLLATYYINTGQIDEEIEIRERLRDQDPWNYFLELALARAYAEAGRTSDLEKSVAIIKRLAPESTEYEQAKALLDSATSTTP
jgi:tetratricopeptide (TPR) repeat protein